MKSSKKILLITGAVLLAGFTISLFLLREQGFHGVAQNENRGDYRTLSNQKITILKVGRNWNVEVIQGMGYRLQLNENYASIERNLQWDGESLNLSDLTTKLQPGDIPVRIMAESFQQIEVAPGATINMTDFNSDSIQIILQDSSHFRAKNVQFKHSSIKTNGHANITFIDKSGD